MQLLLETSCYNLYQLVKLQTVVHQARLINSVKEYSRRCTNIQVLLVL